MYIMPPDSVKAVRKAFEEIEIGPGNNGDALFVEHIPGHLGEEIDRPFELFSDHETLLQILRNDDPVKYQTIHKGTPFFFMAWTAYDMRNFEKALFYLDAAIAEDDLDVFFQVYDDDGIKIGGETKANDITLGVQDRPGVSFLPEPDAQGNVQFVVNWRDVSEPAGTGANGTAISYKCFSIDQDADLELIFADGFESGDTEAWTNEIP